MASNLIFEDDIERDIIKVFESEALGFDYLNCYTANRDDLNDKSNRANKKQVVLLDRLRIALKRLNSELPDDAINAAIEKLTQSHIQQAAFDANKTVYKLVRGGLEVDVTNSNGRTEKRTVQVLDFANPKNNDFLLVAQLWIEGKRWRRPDLIVYINGLPLVMIELKNSNVSVKCAFDDNLTHYKHDIPQLFDYNAFVLLSNARETRISGFDSPWQHFSHWLRMDDEQERINRQQLADKQISLEYAVRSLFQKDRLIDFIENFILYHDNGYKVVAKNHQFFGVNKAVASVQNNHDGKLGVFWHTQGSGKSFSMVMLCRKIFQKLTGNYTFLIVTDRDDLDRQIYRNFLNTGTKKEHINRPNNGEQLRDVLGSNKRYIFTLIQKFGYPSGKSYPVLSERSDIIVIIDEAHRTQYHTLAENMRKGLPNAQFMAFTGTPLLAQNEKTKEWFGDYVSRYDFSQSIEDESTVKLFYDRRVPEVGIANEDLEDELGEIVESENLTDHQIERLENKFASMVSVLTADDRLDTIAKDIVYHFPRRGYQGKAMVICLDKYTAVKMFNKVEAHWKTAIQELNKEISQCANNSPKKEELKGYRDIMKAVEMAVVISEEAGEEDKFKERNLDIKRHRERINKPDENGLTLEDNFKDSDHPLKLVFVCAMWLTGFDAPTVSTLYLDKPMKNHTLMQTIARANRTAPGKTCGIIVDYFNVFRNLNKALADYSRHKDDEDSEEQVDVAAEDKAVLFSLLKDAIAQGDKYCQTLNVDLGEILNQADNFSKIRLFDDYANTLIANDEHRKQFNVYQNTIENIYEACKPDILKGENTDKQLVKVFGYLRGCVDANVDQGNMEGAKQRIANLLDESILADDEVKQKWLSYRINREKEIDVSLLDFDALQTKYKESKLKNMEVAHLRAFIEKKLQDLLEVNHTRKNFVERLQNIINDYNSGGRTTEQTFEDLNCFKDDLSQEDARHVTEGLTEEELELFDLLCKEKLTADERIVVKNAAKDLLHKLKQLIAQKHFWYRDTQETILVKQSIQNVLNDDLPQSYDKGIFVKKCDDVFNLVYERALNSGSAYYH
jgi:type I restriction enzyme R subunit